MKKKSKTAAPLVKTSIKGFKDPKVGAVFGSYPKDMRTKLMALRRLIFDTASEMAGVGELQETLKWGQPSYLTSETKSGSTIRIDQVKPDQKQYAMYFHCQTTLVATFRDLYPKKFVYGGNRSIIFDADKTFPKDALRHCIALALTYHLKRRLAPNRR